MKYFLCFCFTLFGSESALQNILSDEAVCKTYEISIPDYENATNPSLLAYQDGYLLSFRYTCRFPQWMEGKRLLPVASFIGLAELDRQFKVKKKSVQLLEIQSFSDEFSLYAEDARLISFQGRIYVVFNDFPAPLPEYKRQMYLGEIKKEKGRWVAERRAFAITSEGMNRIEKNWVPFFLEPHLYFIYGETPHTLLQCDLSTGACRKVDERFQNLDWSFGIIRGGTPALRIEDQYLTFYHSSIEDLSEIHERRIYFMGAYAFDPFFPFTIRSYTPFPIGHKDFYKGTSAKNHPSKKVVFPGGFVREGNALHVAWGKDDKKVMITTFDLEKLLKSMKKLD